MSDVDATMSINLCRHVSRGDGQLDQRGSTRRFTKGCPSLLVLRSILRDLARNVKACTCDAFPEAKGKAVSRWLSGVYASEGTTAQCSVRIKRDSNRSAPTTCSVNYSLRRSVSEKMRNRR